MENLGNRLKRLRTLNRLQAKEVAEKLGIPASTYREWEYGRAIRGEPYVRLAQLFNVSLYELLTGEPSQFKATLVQLEVIEKKINQCRQNLQSSS